MDSSTYFFSSSRILLFDNRSNILFILYFYEKMSFHRRNDIFVFLPYFSFLSTSRRLMRSFIALNFSCRLVSLIFIKTNLCLIHPAPSWVFLLPGMSFFSPFSQGNFFFDFYHSKSKSLTCS